MNIECNIDDDDFQVLIKNNIIERDYISGRIIVKIPLFENDDTQLLPQHKIAEVRTLVNERVNEYRKLFSGIRAKSIASKSQVINYLTRWLITYPEYSFDDILEATRYYIEITDPKYVSNADNFIFRETKPGEEESVLYTVIEQMELNMSSNMIRKMI